MNREYLIATTSAAFSAVSTWITARAYYVSDIDKKFNVLQ